MRRGCALSAIGQTKRRWPRWALPLIVGVAGFAIVHPLDARLGAAMVRFGQHASGDVRRELEAWQQYGQGLFIGVLVIAVWLTDAAPFFRRRRLLDLGLAVVIAQAVSTGGKMLIGRPRPRPWFGDPDTFLTPWGEYPVKIDGSWKLVHAWDTHAGAGTDLWSMPSSHTLFAATVSVFIAALWPRLRWLVVALTLLVACGRVMFDAHWPTDVVVGGAAGWLIGRCVVEHYAGVRLVDWLWKRVVDRAAAPAFPVMVAHEHASQAK
jgi:membrane-associated phospholipid phosphatase